MASMQNLGPRTVRAGGFAFIDTYKFGIRVINKTGSAIAVDKLVAVTGFDVTSLRPKIVLADADVAAHNDVYVATEAIADGAEGYVYKGGYSGANLDTSGATTVGDPLYLSTTAGGFTSTAPTAANARVVPVGFSTVKSSTVGQIFWFIEPVQKISSDDRQSKSVVTVITASPAVLTAADSGSHQVLDLGTAITVTLPAPVAGMIIRFSVKQNAAHVIQTDGASTFMRGTVSMGLEATTPAANPGPKFFTANGTSHKTMTLGTTGGGLIGSWYQFEAVSTTVWQVTGIGLASGTIVSPFS